MPLKYSLLFFYILIAFPPQSGKAAWWERTTVYEVYPRSLQDSNGDGTGDLNGIRSRLDYFADLGVETLWLTPIFESPMRDNGYDISNSQGAAGTTVGGSAHTCALRSRLWVSGPGWGLA